MTSTLEHPRLSVELLSYRASQFQKVSNEVNMDHILQSSYGTCGIGLTKIL